MTESQRNSGGDAIKVLHIDEDPEQLNYVKRFLEEIEESLKIESIASPDEIPSMILNGTFDAILANYRTLERKEIEFERARDELRRIPWQLRRLTPAGILLDTRP